LACSSRDNAILIWDVGGHSLSPLMGRLSFPSSSSEMGVGDGGTSSPAAATTTTTEPTTTGGSGGGSGSGGITNLKWKKNDDSGGHLLLTTFRDWVGVWDVRIWNRGMRPSQRFSPTDTTANNGAAVRFVSVACSSSSSSYEIAALDSTGVVRVYDERKEGGGGSSTNGGTTGGDGSQIDLFKAHNYRGVGIESFNYTNADGRSGDSSCCDSSSGNNAWWMTWGLESADGVESCVKLWKKEHSKDSSHNPPPPPPFRPSSATLVQETERPSVGVLEQQLNDFSMHMSLSDSDDDGDGDAMKGDAYWYNKVNNDKEATVVDTHSLLRPPILPALNDEDDTNKSYACTVKINVRGLACARVCPDPYGNAIVTVSAPPVPPPLSGGTTTGQQTVLWQTDLWFIRPSSSSLPSSPSRRRDDPNNNTSIMKMTMTTEEKEDEAATNGKINRRSKYKARCLASFQSGGNDDTTLKQMVGENYMGGHLIAAELAVGPGSPSLLPPKYDDAKDNREQQQHQHTTNTNTNDTTKRHHNPNSSSSSLSEEEEEDCELVLCCLDSTGYLTTHAIPEASSTHFKIRAIRAAAAVGNNPMMHLPPSSNTTANIENNEISSHLVLVTGTTGGGGGVLQNENMVEGGGGDGGRLGKQQQYGNNPDLLALSQGQQQQQARGTNPRGQSETDLGHTDLQQQQQQEETDILRGPQQHDSSPPFQFSRGGVVVDGGSLQFKLDHHTAIFRKEPELSTAANSDDREIDNNNNNLLLDNNEEDESRSDDEEPTVDLSKAKRVPCPRLCGATFGIGGGGMIAFQNGNVKEMWSWFRTEVQSRPTTRMVVDTKEDRWAVNKLRFLFDRGEDAGNDDVDDDACPPEESRVLASTSGGSSSGMEREFPKTMYDLMKMNDAAKRAQWGDEESDDGEGAESLGSCEMEDNFDEISGESSSSSSSDSDDFDDTLRGTSASLQGATDHLAPVVFFTQKYDSIVFNGQCSELATMWRLGPWNTTMPSCRLLLDQKHCKSKQQESNRNFANAYYHKDERWDTIDEHDVQEEKNDAVRFTSSKKNRTISMKRSSENTPNFPRSNSSPDLCQVPQQHQHKSNIQQHESVMDSLKQLFSGSQMVGSEVLGIPPNQQESMHHHNNNYSNTNNTSQQKNNNNDVSHYSSEQNTHHMHKIAVRRSREIELHLFLQIKDICSHNANAANALGQSGKGDVWNLLAGIVDNMSSGEFDDFDGWKGLGLGSLGRELLRNILNYYEAQGDVQMLATIVCVFNAGKDRKSYHDEEISSSPLHILLPDEQTAKYDAYLDLYGRLLYGWGAMDVRAELNKHLTSLPRIFGEHYFNPADSPWNSKGGGTPQFYKENFGITFAPYCPRCLKPANPDTNICHSCWDFAFRCAICTNAVRGLFTVCMACGHGGHVEHMMEWFTEKTVCPSGCGCNCTLSTFCSPRDQNAMPSDRERRMFAGKAIQKGLFTRSPAVPKSSQIGRSEEFGFGSVPYGAYCLPIYTEDSPGQNLQF